MEILFFLIMTLSIIVMLFNNPSQIIISMQNACTSAVELCVKLLSVYALWLGLLEIVDKSGVGKVLAKILSPLIRFLFGNIDEETSNLVALNLASNILGVSNASTPSGIMAMEKFDRGDGKINKNMLIFAIINCCSLQIIPSTLMSMRTIYNSTSASDIILPNLIASYVTTAIAVTITLITEKRKMV